MVIKSTKGSCKRTKERIKQHGPEFIILDARIVICLDNQLGYLVQSIKTDWIGWLPYNELDLDPR
jgi:hypothetical protein